jgi:hypothetical protein
MESLSDGVEGIVAEFAAWVKELGREFAAVGTPVQAAELEGRIRCGGQAILRKLLEVHLQAGVDRNQQQHRPCPKCGGRHRHRGTRCRQLLSSLGLCSLRGIYWQCPDCGHSFHSVDLVAPQRYSPAMAELVLLLGVSCTSFAKAQLLAGTLLQVKLEDDTIRRHCEAAGQQGLSCPPEPLAAAPAELLVGSCDGTMVNTREDRWREVKAARFRCGEREYALATLEAVEGFVPKMAALAKALEGAGQKVFVSDCAEWISRAVAGHLPGWKHVADYWHATQHIAPVAELLYGQEQSVEGRDFAEYFSRELRAAGGAQVADELRQSAMSYSDLKHQRAVLDLAKFFDKHAQRMAYPQYLREGLPVDSGPMESLCKQLGLRMKGPGMRWSTRNVSAMAYLVAKWAVDPKAAVEKGLAA